LPDLPEARANLSADQAFNYVWATQIIDQVITQVERECRSTNKVKHWQIFSAKILDPIIKNESGPSLRELCKQYRVANEARASNMIITVKRCFRRTLENQLRSFVHTDSEIADELNDLLGIIAKRSAG
jgi:hypothetical protein